VNQISETRVLLESLYQQARQHLERAGAYSGGFKAINNKIAICNKIFDSKDIRFSTNEEGIEALKLILRDFLFIATLSVFEYNLLTIFPHKKAPIVSLEIKKKGLRKTNFSDLITWIDRDGLLSSSPLWKFAIKIRNDVVHFNGRALSSLQSPDVEIRIFVVEGEVISGELISFVKFIQKLEADYFNLICQLKT